MDEIKQPACERPGCFGKMKTVDRKGQLYLKCPDCGLLLAYPITQDFENKK